MGVRRECPSPKQFRPGKGRTACQKRTNEYTLGSRRSTGGGPESRGLAPRAERVLERARQALGEEEVAPELRASQLE